MKWLQFYSKHICFAVSNFSLLFFVFGTLMTQILASAAQKVGDPTHETSKHGARQLSDHVSTSILNNYLPFLARMTLFQDHKVIKVKERTGLREHREAVGESFGGFMAGCLSLTRVFFVVLFQ